MADSSQPLVFNGINATTGDYLLPPLSAEVIGQIARGEQPDERHLQELRYRYTRKNKTFLGPKAGVDPNKIEEAGWGVIFTTDAPQAVRDALLPLLNRRQAQAGKYFREFSRFVKCRHCAGHCGYRNGESKVDFLARHGAGPGPADPDNVPYYLLIVGDPEAVSFRFQYQLDVQYAVGRIHFDATEEYANYAASVVAAETRPLSLSRKAVFFAARNPGDAATSLSASELVEPLYNKVNATPGWEFDKVVAERATKSALGEILGGTKTPSFLFTATHGIGFPEGDPRQLQRQGGLLCQDWPGPTWKQSIPEDFYFSGDDLGGDANPFGLIAFFFACYGAGTPRLDDFAHAAFSKTRPVIAPHAFLASLPRRLLSHPKGGALAVVGHVDRAWSYSFQWEKAGSQVGTFEAALKLMLEGRPLGSALEFFNERYAELSSHLTDELEEIRFGKTPNDYELAGMWTANNDSRSYVIIGDPAVRLAVAPAGQAASARPALSLAQPPVHPRMRSSPPQRPPVAEAHTQSVSPRTPMLPTATQPAGVAGRPDDVPLDEVQRIKAEVWGPALGGPAAFGPSRPLLVAKGDSWFDYPPGLDILDHLRRTHWYPIIKLSQAGDTLENMVYGTEYNRDFSRNPAPFGTLIDTVGRVKPAAVLFSAGGNDVAGDDLASFLNHRDSGRPLLQEAHLLDMIHGFARAAYERAATEVWKVAPDALFVTHGYGHPIPDGRAVFNFPFGFRYFGPWLRPAFTKKNIEQIAARDIMRRVIDEFNAMLGNVAVSLGSRFVYIDLRGSITDADWVNELHLSSAAYGRVAAEFDQRLPREG